MTATSSGPSRRTRFLVRRSSLAAPVNSTKLGGAAISRLERYLWPGPLVTLHGGQELLAAEHTLNFLAPIRLPERFDASVGRIAGHLLDPEMSVCTARNLRQVGDRQYLRAPRETLQRLADRVRRLPADPGVDLVADERLAPAHR